MPTVLVSTTIPPGDLAKLQRVVAALHVAGDKGLKRELRTGLSQAVRPMQRTFRAGALGYLPLHGGLGEDVAAGMRFRTSVSVAGSPRLRITAEWPGHDLPALNRGRVRHPVFGHRDRWVTERVRPRFWDDAGIVGAQEAYPEIEKAVDRTADKLEVEL